MPNENSQPQGPILLFDGVCNFCSATVNFVMDNDKSGKIKFGALQTDEAAALLEPFGLDNQKLDSLVYIDNGKAYKKSDAALQLGMRMGGALQTLAALGFLVPRLLRDKIYDHIAAHRYAWFGKKDACRMPTPEERDRFIAMSS